MHRSAAAACRMHCSFSAICVHQDLLSSLKTQWSMPIKVSNTFRSSLIEEFQCSHLGEAACFPVVAKLSAAACLTAVLLTSYSAAQYWSGRQLLTDS